MPTGKVRPWRGRSQLHRDQNQQRMDELSRAASILLAESSSVLFSDMCPSCSSTLRTRLSSIASGNLVVADTVIEEISSPAFSTLNEAARTNKTKATQQLDCPSLYFATGLSVEERNEDTHLSEFLPLTDYQSNGETYLHQLDIIKKSADNGKRQQTGRDSVISTNNGAERRIKTELADLPVEERHENSHQPSDFPSSTDHPSNRQSSLHQDGRIKNSTENGTNHEKRRQLRRDSVGSIMLRKALQSIGGTRSPNRRPNSGVQFGQTIAHSTSNGSVQVQAPISLSCSAEQRDSSPLLQQSCASPLLEQPSVLETNVASPSPEQFYHSVQELNRTPMSEVVRKKDFCMMERVKGRTINILEGLELHQNVFSSTEQEELVAFVYELQELGRQQKLQKRTYSEPRKWMRGKGRVTLQFGCCYNYAVDKDGNPPGILREEEVDEIPHLFRMAIKRMVEWEVLPSNCVPDSCIVNIYEVGDCIPPHIDHHDFLRPFCTLSLLSECKIIFGTNLQVIGPGEFKGSYSIPLPTGSVLILNGNGADVAKHSVPAVPTRRISITFRKMDPLKVPRSFTPDKELLSTWPLNPARCNKNNMSTFDSDLRKDMCTETNFDNEKEDFIN